jgi:6-phosphogluconolactonase
MANYTCASGSPHPIRYVACCDYSCSMQTRVLSDPAAVAQYAADLLATELSRSGSSLGLAGGSTPSATYEALAKSDTDWDRIPVWLADERWVPSTHDQSNQRMAMAAFSGAIDSSLVPVPWNLSIDANTGAMLYEDYLRMRLPVVRDRIHPDLVVLGIGDDGHTASLFPGTSALDAQGDYVANWVPKLDTWRITATTTMLQAARKIVFIVTGEGKAKTMREIMEPHCSHPAAVVAQGATDVVWVLDGAAASELESP